MPRMLDVIKAAAVEAVDAEKPLELVYGTVMSKQPITIKFDEKRTLDETFLVYTETVKGTLEKGDEVIALVVQGGQEYVVLDRKVV